MNRVQKIGLILGLLLLVPTSGAVVLQDPYGDVAVSVYDRDAASVPPGLRDSFDIMALDVVETEDQLTFVLETAQYHTPDEDVMVDHFFSIRFDVAPVEYVVTWGENTGGAFSSGLYVRDNIGAWGKYLGPVHVDIEPESATYRFSIARNLLADGDVLSNLDATILGPAMVSFMSSVFLWLFLGDSFMVVLQDQIGLESPGQYRFQAPENEGQTNQQSEAPAAQEAPGMSAALALFACIWLASRRRPYA